MILTTEPRLRRPTAADGPALHSLVAACPPLDLNSAYAYLLICQDFASTSIVATAPDGSLAGAVTGYRPPHRPDALFIWQVAVHPDWRGCRLARRMLDAILDRECNQDAIWLETTVSPDNTASRALFASLARSRGLGHAEAPLFGEDLLGPDHEPEWLHRIGPMTPALQEA